jgi:hypothetical protein
MTSFKISNTLCPCPQPDNLLITNLDGNINTFKIIFEDQYVKIFWNPIVKQIQVSFKIDDLVIRGINELINIKGNNTIAFQLTPIIDNDHYLTDSGSNLDTSFSYNTIWNTGIIKFTSIGAVKLPYYSIVTNTFATSVFFTITKLLT